MNEVFEYDPQTQTWPWLNPILAPLDPYVGDRVGKYDANPRDLNGLYPAGNTSGWTWAMNQAYYIYRDLTDPGSPAHFWEYQNQPDYQQASFPLIPSDAWDLNPVNYWYFLAYPLRCSQMIDPDGDGWSENSTIHDLEIDPVNPMLILKSDDGKLYIPATEIGNPLVYLEPGRGYFAGFAYPTTITCAGFAGEYEPASVPGGGDKGTTTPGSQIASLESTHFTFKSRTHWWYPVVIDTVDLGSVAPEVGDEIGIFDGDLCVGATVYPDSFPINLAAWQDDIATPPVVDGYIYGHEMIFKWFDISTNQEITFTPPPSTQGMDDPVAPTHSGFGAGFYARRGFTDGVQEVKQLPTSYHLGQNFPNPFNAETIIPLELPQRSHVKIELFNVRGQCLGVIFEGTQNAGWPKIRYNASALASGMYFCRVMAEGLERGGKYQNVGKMLLLK